MPRARPTWRTTTLRHSPVSAEESRSNYWIYLSNFPCHHKLPKNAEKDALTMLQLMIVRKHISQEPYTYIFISRPENLADSEGVARTPFSMPDIQRYIDFLTFSRTLEDSHDDVPSAKGFIICNIIANFCAPFALVSTPGPYITTDESQLQPAMTTHADTNRWKVVIIFACWGMPPNYVRRFDAAYDTYGRTLQPDAWKSFLDVVRRERAAANVLVSSRLFHVPNNVWIMTW